MMTPQQMLNIYSEMGSAVREGIENIRLTGLRDTPTGYQGHSGDYLVVNDNESGIHFTGIEKIAADLTDYGFGGGGGSSTIPSYTDLPDVTENDGKIVASGCDLYHSCDGSWNKVGGESIPAPTEDIPGCVETLEDYNNYINYVDSVISNGMSSAFEESFNFGVKENFFNDVCLHKEVLGEGQAIVKIQQSNYQFGIFENNTNINISAETPVTAGYYTSLHIKSDVNVNPNGQPGYDVALSLQSNTTNGSTTFTDLSENNLVISSNENTQHSTAVVKYGASSLDFNELSYLSVPGDSAELLFEPNEDITIEHWFNITEDPAMNDYGWQVPMISKGPNNTAYHGWSVGYVHPNSTTQTAHRGKIAVRFNGGGGWGSGSWALFGSTVLNKNEWYHVAIVREDGVWNLYLNGVLENSSDDITSGGGTYMKLSNYDLTIGAGTSYSSGSNINTNNGFIGYLQDIRISRGASYIQSFTPPTTFLNTVGEPDTRTPERLSLQDSSLNNTIIQNINNIEHTSNTTNIYGKSSIYFNREDYLLINKDTAGLNFTADDEITFEFWMKYIDVIPVDHQSYVPILAKGPMNTVSKSFVIGITTDGNIRVQLMQNRDGGQQFSSVGSIAQDVWGHVAVTRKLKVEEGISYGYWSIYIDGVQQNLNEVSTSSLLSENGKSMREYNTVHLDNSAYHFTVGSAYAYSPMTLEANKDKYYGYLQDIRIVKGNDVYDQDFTPTNTFLSSVDESDSVSCNFVEWKTSDTSIIGDVNSNNSTALISQDTSITGVFNCT